MEPHAILGQEFDPHRAVRNDRQPIRLKLNKSIATGGTGLWSEHKANVHCTWATLAYLNDERNFGELRVFFSRRTWDPKKYGLIYTDREFMDGLRQVLVDAGLSAAAVKGVNYSEQGMQGDDYVSCDVRQRFIEEFGALCCKSRRGEHLQQPLGSPS